jgi:hypothetical protein
MGSSICLSPGAGTLLAFPCGLGHQPESKRLVYKDINQYTFFYIKEKNYLNYPIIQPHKKKQKLILQIYVISKHHQVPWRKCMNLLLGEGLIFMEGGMARTRLF